VKISAQMTVVMSAIFAVVCFGVAITGFLSLGDIADATQMADAKGIRVVLDVPRQRRNLVRAACAVDGAHAEGRLLSTTEDGERMLYEPSRHEALRPIPLGTRTWSGARSSGSWRTPKRTSPKNGTGRSTRSMRRDAHPP
jgi:hypothetical protein